MAADAASDDDLLRVLRHHKHCPRTLRPLFDDWDGLVAHAGERGMPFDAPPAAVLDHWRALYDAGLASTDDEVGRLLDGLAERGQLEDTLVVVVSDHGESFGEHGLVGHGKNLFEPLLRAVLLLRLPRRAPGLEGPAPTPRRVPQVVRTVDVAPTLAELLALPAAGDGAGDRAGVGDGRGGPVAVQGESLLPLLRGEGAARDERLAFSHAPSSDGPEGRHHAVRGARWRLVSGPDGDRLSDLETDPAELRDHAAEHPGVVEKLRARLDAQRALDAALRRRLGGASAGELSDLSAERLDELRALGYLGDG